MPSDHVQNVIEISNQTEFDLVPEQHHTKYWGVNISKCSIEPATTESIACGGKTAVVASWRLGKSSLNLVVFLSASTDSQVTDTNYLGVGFKDNDYPPAIDGSIYEEMLISPNQTWFKREKFLSDSFKQVEVVDGSKRFKASGEIGIIEGNKITAKFVIRPLTQWF